MKTEEFWFFILMIVVVFGAITIIGVKCDALESRVVVLESRK